MRLLLSFLVFTVALPTFSAHEKTTGEILQNYPYQSPAWATFTNALLKPRTDLGEKRRVLTTKKRQHLHLLSRPGKTPYYYILQEKKAPFVFLIPGLGGEGKERGVRYYIEMLYFMGYHVVAMPSTMHESFPHALSTSGIVGLSSQDAKDMLRGMQYVFQGIKQETNVQVSSFSLVGYSLGGLTAAFVGKEDRRQKIFNFNSIVLINPPVSLHYSMKQLDLYFNEGARSRNLLEQMGLMISTFFKGYDAFTGSANDPSHFLGLDRQIDLSEQEIRFLMGMIYRRSLADLIYSTQVVNDLNILKNSVYEKQKARSEIRSRFGFQDYVNVILRKHLESTRSRAISVERLDRENSLTALEDYLKGNEHISIIHSADDFVVSKDHLRWIKETFGKRAIIFRYGGHLGHIWSKESQAVISKALAVH